MPAAVVILAVVLGLWQMWAGVAWAANPPTAAKTAAAVAGDVEVYLRARGSRSVLVVVEQDHLVHGRRVVVLFGARAGADIGQCNALRHRLWHRPSMLAKNPKRPFLHKNVRIEVERGA